jgi:hypothetical protein
VFDRVWIISDGKIGDVSQCRGVCEALGVVAEERVVAPRAPWLWFLPWGPLPPKDRRGRPGSPIGGPLPQLAIASGRRTLAYLREIKRAGSGEVFTVYLKDPRARADYVDLFWVPVHDRLRGNNVVVTLTSPHRYAPERLASQFGAVPDYLRELPKPMIGVLLGGDSRDFRYTDADCGRLASALRQLAEQGGGLAITPSRRTPAKLAAGIRAALAGQRYFWWDGNGENPYGYMLAHADRLVVTADSTNMVMEACVTGRPVYYFRPTGGSDKIERMLSSLTDYGAIRPLPEAPDALANWSYPPLYASDIVAAAIRKAAAARGFG